MNKFFKTIRYLSIMIFVVIISAVITYIINPNFSDTLNSISRNISKSVSQKSGLSLVIAYIFNNGFRVPISMLILSIISIQFLYWIQPLFTAILPGILFGSEERIQFAYELKKQGMSYKMIERKTGISIATQKEVWGNKKIC